MSDQRDQPDELLHPDYVVSDHVRYLAELIEHSTLKGQPVDRWHEDVSEDGRQARLTVTYTPIKLGEEPGTGVPLFKRHAETFVFNAAEAHSFAPEFVLIL